MKTSRKIPFSELPKDYPGLCSFHTPRPIHDSTDYENTMEIIESMVLWEESFSRDQRDYFEVLVTLIEHYEHETVDVPHATPIDTLKHLMIEHGLVAADLSRILGSSRHLGAMILRGERSITATHARALGSYFNLPAGIFIE